MTGAFALSAALFQRERTGKGQRIDMAMLDVAMILMSSHLTGYLRNGTHPKPKGNRHPHATNGAFQTKDGIVMIGASNVRQQKRLWPLLGHPEMAKNEQRRARRRPRARSRCSRRSCWRRTADEWETFLQANHVPACRVRTHGRGGRRPADRDARHFCTSTTARPEVEGGFSVPLAAFKFAHGGRASRRRRRGSASTTTRSSPSWASPGQDRGGVAAPATPSPSRRCRCASARRTAAADFGQHRDAFA